MKSRFFKVLKVLFILGILGIIYILWVKYTGLGLGCPFYKISGLFCPGCGVSRMFLNIFKGDFYLAFRSNVLLFTMLPVFVVYSIYKFFTYVKYGVQAQKKIETILIWGVVFMLILFGVLRNIDYFSYLSPFNI